MYILISVCERSITTAEHTTFESAREEMVTELLQSGVAQEDYEQFIETARTDPEKAMEEVDDFSITDDSAWSNCHHTNNDWLIIAVGQDDSSVSQNVEV